MSLDAAVWAGRRVLVTGHTGFKGSWLAVLLSQLGAKVSGLALDPEPRGTYELAGVADLVESHLYDIRDRAAVKEVFEQTQPQSVFHLAAQSLVRRGVADPVGTFETNVLGTAHVLDAARRTSSVSEILVATSDKVYANDETGRPFVETDPLGGHDPYSASKAACELLVASWRDTYARGVPPRIVTARAGNVIGGGDVASDRLLPDLFRSVMRRELLVVRYPSAVRPWQFVLEPVTGYVKYLEHAIKGVGVPDALNFGPTGDSTRTVAEVASEVLTRLGEGPWQRSAETQPAEAHLLALDASLAGAALGWLPSLDLSTALEWTCEWFKTERGGGDCAGLCRQQIERFQEPR